MLSPSDLRAALRSAIRRPGLSASVIVTLAIGIGSATAVIDLVNLLAWRRLPAEHPSELVKLYSRHSQEFIGPWGGTRIGDARIYEKESGAFAGLSPVLEIPELLDSGERSRRVSVGAVEGAFFDWIGVTAARGRLPGTDDDRAGSEPVTALSERLWRQLGSDPEILGETVRLGAVEATVIGIVPERFANVTAGTTIDAWIPLGLSRAMLDQPPDPEALEALETLVVGRLAAGVSLEEASSRIRAIATRLDETRPRDDELIRDPTLVEATIGHPIDRERLAPSLRLFGLAAALLLLIACSNASHLLLARAAGRRREMALRQAVGASRGRLVQQVLAEGFVLAGAAAIAGLGLALAGRRLLGRFAGEAFSDEMRFDHRVLGLTLAIALVSTLIFGLTPALLATRFDHASLLRAGTDRHSSGRGVFGTALGVVQIGLIVVLLGSGALLLRSVEKLRTADLGFDDVDLSTTFLDFPRALSEPEQWLETSDRIAETVRSIPGVHSAALGSLTPPIMLDIFLRFRLPEDPETVRSTRFAVADPEWFDVVGIRLRRGRLFEDGDRDGPAAVVVGHLLAEELWPGQDPLGRVITVLRNRPQDLGPDYRVIGIVDDVRQYVAADGPEPVLYFSTAQRPRPSRELVLRSSLPTASLAETLRERLREIDPELTVEELHDGNARRKRNLVIQRLQAQTVALIAGMGLVLALLGIFGLFAFDVASRTREIGIRSALGADPRAVRRMILLSCLRLAAGGLVLGAVGLIVASRFLEGQLHGITAHDPVTHGTVVLFVVAAVLAAAMPPAFRASRVDPRSALRDE